MLRSFRLENHRSFRGEAELSLLPSYRTERQALPVAAIYGANAAGKSNLLGGLRFMARAVQDSYRRWEPEGGVPRQPFRLDPEARTRPSTFVVDLVVAEVRYVYGFQVDDEQVLEEWLYSYPLGKKREIFTREGSSVKLGSTVSALHRAQMEVLAGLTRPNALFLSLAAQVGLTELTPVREWFVSGLRWGQPPGLAEVRAARSILPFLQSDEDRGAVTDLVRAADLGITELRVDTDDEVLDARLLDRRMLPNDATARTPKNVSLSLRELANESARTPLERLVLLHGNHAEPFDLADESAGTRAWIGLLPLVLRSLRQASTLVVDEIDTSLHPHLTAHLVSLFRSEQTNPGGAQLIFTTHDASLLGTTFDEDVLARDQVWFVEKEPEGSSSLYPLTDFHPRKGENRERRYLGGSYGAVPNVNGSDRIVTSPATRP